MSKALHLVLNSYCPSHTWRIGSARSALGLSSYHIRFREAFTKHVAERLGL